MRNKLVLAGLAVLAAFGIACGVGSGDTDSSVGGGGGQRTTPAGSDGPVTAAMGETVTLTSTFLDETDTVEITLANPEQHTREPGEYGSTADNGVFLVVTVTAVCVQGTYHANPFNFKFVAANGTAYEQAFAFGFEPELSAVHLSAGQRTSGKIVFDVPEAALTGGRIQVDGIGSDYDEPAAYWAL